MEIEGNKISEISNNNNIESDEFLKAVQEYYASHNKNNKIPIISRNRRYAKLQKLIEEGDYFSEEQIKFRDPVLFFIYVGRYKREGEFENSSFYELLNKQILNKEYQELLEKAWFRLYKKDISSEKIKDKKQISAEDLENNEDELIRLMHEKFLLGDDSEFIDYDEIDNNELYDDLKLLEHDQEDLYFAQENEENIEMKLNTKYTGIQDY